MSEALKLTSAPRPRNRHPDKGVQGKKKIFDKQFLDELFPKKRTHSETAPKKRAGTKSKARRFAQTHRYRGDESGSKE